jgi:SAM-dependent methyltransferase
MMHARSMSFARVKSLFQRRGRPLEAEEAYRLWAPAYPPEPHNALMRLEQDVVTPMIRSAAPRRALDVGTGSGRYGPVIAAAGAQLVVGVDASMAMLSRQASGAARVCGDARRLPFRDRSFDLVAAMLMVGDLPDLGVWIREVARVLRGGGHLIYSDFHEAWAANGWRRTFRDADGRAHEIVRHPHTIDEHLDALEQWELSVRAVREPRLNDGAGRPFGWARRSVPVLVVFHAVKDADRFVRPRPRVPAR